MCKKDTNVATDNIVGRLYNLIYALKNTEGSNSEDVFCKVFSLEQNNKTLILSNYAELFKMCILGINEIEQLQPKNINKYKNTLNNVIDGLSKISFDTSYNINGLSRFYDHFNDTLMLSLEYCADYLSEHSDESNIEDEKIQKLIKEIDEIMEYVLSCKLHNELEKLLIFQLNNIRESLLKYQLYGSKGIKNSISTTLGTLILNREKINKQNDKTVMEKIFKIISKINALVSLKNNSVKLLGAICKQITETD